MLIASFGQVSYTKVGDILVGLPLSADLELGDLESADLDLGDLESAMTLPFDSSMQQELDLQTNSAEAANSEEVVVVVNPPRRQQVCNAEKESAELSSDESLRTLPFPS